MSQYKPLTKELESWFDKPLCELPEDLRDLVLRDFFLVPWDTLLPDQRRSVAQQMDYQQDPETEADRVYWWDFFERKGALEKRILEWENVATPTASDLVQKEARLANLRSELAQMSLEERHGRESSGNSKERIKPMDSLCQPAISTDISLHFRVVYDQDQNDKWWKKCMRDAKKNGLSDCRVGEGKRGPGGSLWRPDLVAAWLVDRSGKNKKGLSIVLARSALNKFPGYQEIAESLFAADE